MILIGVVFTGDPRMQQIFRGNYGKAVKTTPIRII